MILRMALPFHFPFGTPWGKKENARVREHGFNLSAQLLATCQVLHKEASPVLYEEGVLELEVWSALSNDTPVCIALDAYIPLPEKPEDLPDGEQRLLRLLIAGEPEEYGLFEECYKGVSQEYRMSILEPSSFRRMICSLVAQHWRSFFSTNELLLCRFLMVCAVRKILK